MCEACSKTVTGFGLRKFSDNGEKMKIAYRTQPYKDYDIGDALKQLARLGYDGVELCLEHPDTNLDELTDSKIAGVKNLLQENNLGLSSVSLHCNFVENDVCFSDLKRAILITKKFDTDILVISTGPVCLSELESQKATLRKRLRELLALCAAHDIKLALEPEPNFIIATTAEMLALIEEMNSECLKCNFDVGHSYISDPSLLKAIKLLGKEIIHTHIEDIRAKKHYHLIPGEGDIDLQAVVEAFSNIGFDGYLTVDLFNFDPSVAAAPSLDYLRACVRSTEK